jgi:hypothetical protein
MDQSKIRFGAKRQTGRKGGIAIPESLAFFKNQVTWHAGETPVWDGTSASRRIITNMYTYWIEYEDKNDGTIQIQAGDVLLVRLLSCLLSSRTIHIPIFFM